jgi:glyoxylase-like metal-dependent hydrolase (beta-lactamase superfamily II)
VIKKIKDRLRQIGGSGLTDPADAAVYLVRFGDNAAPIDAGCGQGHSRLRKNIAEALYPNGGLDCVLLTHCRYDYTGGPRR